MFAWCLRPFQKLIRYCTVSLERYLTISFISMLTIVTIIMVIANYYQLSQQYQLLFKTQLVDAAHILNSVTSGRLKKQEIDDLQNLLSEPESNTVAKLFDKVFHPKINIYQIDSKNLAYQIWDIDTNQLILRSSNAPTKPLSDMKQGFTMTTSADQRVWYTYTLYNHDIHTKITVGVDHKTELRLKLTTFIKDLSITVSFYLLIVILIIIIIRLGLRHLKQIANIVRQSKPNNLYAISDQNAPTEVLPLIHAINQLFQQIENTLYREKRFTGDAAHELRTPLAAFKIQVEVAMRAKTEQERLTILNNVLLSANRCSHVIDQLLTLSRLEPEAQLQDTAQINVVSLAAQLLSEMAILAVNKEIELSFSHQQDDILLSANATGTGILLRNLIDNAIRYTASGGKVNVHIEQTDHHVILSVTDNGTGIPEAEINRIFDRFFRGSNHKESGSGLGMSIVQQIVRLHRATIKAEKPAEHQGLRVTVSFPLT